MPHLSSDRGYLICMRNEILLTNLLLMKPGWFLTSTTLFYKELGEGGGHFKEGEHNPSRSIKEKGPLISDEKTDFALAVSDTAPSGGIAQVIIKQNLIFMPAWTDSNEAPFHTFCGMRWGHSWRKARMHEWKNTLNVAIKLPLSNLAAALSSPSQKALAQQITTTWDYKRCTETDGHTEHTHASPFS